MDYEKKYKKALEKTRQLCAYPTTQPFISDLQDIFPELAESEDERIRKWIIGLLSTYEHDRDLRDAAIAWLERQCSQILANSAKTCKDKQKPTEEYNITGIKSKHAQGKLGEMIKRKLEMEKQGEQILANSAKTCKDEQKPDDKKGMNLDEDEMTPFQKKVFCIIDTTIEEEQGLKQVCDELLRLAHDEIMQESFWSEEDESLCRQIEGILSVCVTKSLLSPDLYKKMLGLLKSLKERVQPQTRQGWSEEDEENLKWFEKFFRAESVFAEGKNIPQDRYLWFKNLKDRVQPQPKQEWSEEDDIMIRSITLDLMLLKDRDGSVRGRAAYQREIDWFKSLKERYTWKPSEEQMKILNEVLNFAANHESSHWNDYIFGTLNNLIRQLKKLKG